MLRPIFIGLHRPVSYPVDPNAVFQPGMIAQLNLVGDEVVMGVSNGIAPIGIIDDIRTISFVEPVVDEQVIIVAQNIVNDGYVRTLGNEQVKLLQNANIMEQSFRANVGGLDLTSINGALTAPAGTPLNYQSSPASNGFDSILTYVNYSYYVPNRPGEDTTMGSGQLSVWLGRGIVMSTTQYETDSVYGLNSPLYVSPNGKLTSERSMDEQPAVGMVTCPPVSFNNFLEFIWG